MLIRFFLLTVDIQIRISLHMTQAPVEPAVVRAPSESSRHIRDWKQTGGTSPLRTVFHMNFIQQDWTFVCRLSISLDHTHIKYALLSGSQKLTNNIMVLTRHCRAQICCLRKKYQYILISFSIVVALYLLSLFNQPNPNSKSVNA